MGKELRQRRRPNKIENKGEAAGYFVGTIKLYDRDKKYGFIDQEGMPVDIFFHHSAIRGRVKLQKGTKLRYRLDKAKDGRLVAVDVMETAAD